MSFKDKVKIFNYGLFHITSCEKAVRFPVGLVIIDHTPSSLTTPS